MNLFLNDKFLFTPFHSNAFILMRQQKRYVSCLCYLSFSCDQLPDTTRVHCCPFSHRLFNYAPFALGNGTVNLNSEKM